MPSAIIGDIIGSTCEFKNADRYDFDPFPKGSDFTDDTVLTAAVADAILTKRNHAETVIEYALNYPSLTVCALQNIRNSYKYFC